jgi:hypothetical protein
LNELEPPKIKEEASKKPEIKTEPKVDSKKSKGSGIEQMFGKQKDKDTSKSTAAENPTAPAAEKPTTAAATSSATAATSKAVSSKKPSAIAGLFAKQVRYNKLNYY